MSAELEAVDGLSRLRMQRTLAHPRIRVWEAITKPALLAGWFPAAVEMTPQEDSEITFDSGDGMVTHGVVRQVEPPDRLAFTWGEDLLAWELAEQGDLTVLIFTHTFADRAGAASFAAGWDACFDALDSTLAGQPVPESRDTTAAHEAYVKAFGLDEGAVEETAGGWRLRFERQLTQPAELVWRVLTASSAPIAGGPVPHDCAVKEFTPGMITSVHPPDVLEYQWLDPDRPAGQVHWELVAGTGQGARLILTQTGAADTADLRQTALAAWKARIEELAEELAGHVPALVGRGSEPEPDFAEEHRDMTVGQGERGGPEGSPEPESPRGYGGADL